MLQEGTSMLKWVISTLQAPISTLQGGAYKFARGYFHIAFGDFCVARGYFRIVIGNCCIAFGNYNKKGYTNWIHIASFFLVWFK